MNYLIITLLSLVLISCSNKNSHKEQAATNSKNSDQNQGNNEGRSNQNKINECLEKQLNFSIKKPKLDKQFVTDIFMATNECKSSIDETEKYLKQIQKQYEL